MKRFNPFLFAALTALAPAAARAQPPAPRELPLPVERWRVVERDSGPVNYYAVVRDPSGSFIRARYEPPNATTVLGFTLPEGDRKAARVLRWSWRALTLPRGGNECQAGKEDSAAVVYATWKRGLRYYTLKFVWSSVGPKGATCDRKRNMFVAQDTVILESGGAGNDWRSEEVDLPSEFRRHFEGGRSDAEVPDFMGVGLMTDGDQTKSQSAADYARFVVGF